MWTGISTIEKRIDNFKETQTILKRKVNTLEYELYRAKLKLFAMSVITILTLIANV